MARVAFVSQINSKPEPQTVSDPSTAQDSAVTARLVQVRGVVGNVGLRRGGLGDSTGRFAATLRQKQLESLIWQSITW